MSDSDKYTFLPALHTRILCAKVWNTGGKLKHVLNSIYDQKQLGVIKINTFESMIVCIDKSCSSLLVPCIERQWCVPQSDIFVVHI